MTISDEQEYVTFDEALVHVLQLQKALKKIDGALKVVITKPLAVREWGDNDGWKYQITRSGPAGWVLIIVPPNVEIGEWLASALPAYMPDGFKDRRLIIRIR